MWRGPGFSMLILLGISWRVPRRLLTVLLPHQVKSSFPPRSPLAILSYNLLQYTSVFCSLKAIIQDVPRHHPLAICSASKNNFTSHTDPPKETCEATTEFYETELHPKTAMGITYSLFFPPPPRLTEANLIPQHGQVFIITGGYSGVGLELARMLHAAHGTVYIAGRSREKADAAMKQIHQANPDSTGILDFLNLALDDLTTIRPAVDEFLSKETRLDVLFNNAGVSNPPLGSVSKQGYELQFATHCLGPWLLTQLLTPILTETAKTSGEEPGSVRVVWTSSIVNDLSVPKGGLEMRKYLTPSQDQQENYTYSKAGNWLLASEYLKQVGGQGVLSVVQNPGNLKSNLLRHFPWWVGYLVAPLLYQARYGAYTELWAGLSEDLRIEDGGKFVLPWGRLHPCPREDLLRQLRTKEEGGDGLAAQLKEYVDRIVDEYRSVFNFERER